MRTESEIRLIMSFFEARSLYKLLSRLPEAEANRDLRMRLSHLSKHELETLRTMAEDMAFEEETQE